MNRGFALWALVIGGIALLAFRKNPATPSTIPTAGTSSYTPSQPSQLFPVTGLKDPRVDNASQPWYTGPIIPGAEQASPLALAQLDNSSLSKVWSGLENLFGSTDTQDLGSDARVSGTGATVV